MPFLWHNKVRNALTRGLPFAGREAAGLLNTVGVSDTATAYVELVLDIQDLQAAGRSNAEIAAALELTSPDAEQMIEYLGQRHQDRL